MNNHNVPLGVWAEEQAVAYLKKEGYKILDTNYRCSLGEIDIISSKDDVLCFVEVKSRIKKTYDVLPEEAVHYRKQKKLSEVALSYLKQHNLLTKKARFDVVTVLVDCDSSFEYTIHDIEVIPDAFDLVQNYMY